MKLVASVTALVVLAAVSTGLAATQLHPLVSGWEQFFKLEWEAADQGGKPVVWGKILNDWGVPAANMRLLVEGLDSSGAVTDQRVEWLGALQPGMRAQFSVRMPRPAPSYRVSVFAFDWVQAGGSELD